MANDWFQFKQFRIEQKNTAMKVGTDSLLLGSWIKPDSVSSVLDVGCGTGILSLMMAQRFDAKIIGVEIDEAACIDAKKNFQQSKWKDRIRLIPSSFQEFIQNNNLHFDLLVSNPPYFQNSKKSPDSSRNLARHTDALPLPGLLSGAFRLLKEDGMLALILPAEIVPGFLMRASIVGFYCNRQLLVKPKSSKGVHRSILELIKKKTECRYENLIVYGAEGYSEAYKSLTKDFYLNF